MDPSVSLMYSYCNERLIEMSCKESSLYHELTDFIDTAALVVRNDFELLLYDND